jgi:hypothetical protein
MIMAKITKIVLIITGLLQVVGQSAVDGRPVEIGIGRLVVVKFVTNIVIVSRL